MRVFAPNGANLSAKIEIRASDTRAIDPVITSRFKTDSAERMFTSELLGRIGG